jgi:hypothetical protein
LERSNTNHFKYIPVVIVGAAILKISSDQLSTLRKHKIAAKRDEEVFKKYSKLLANNKRYIDTLSFDVLLNLWEKYHLFGRGGFMEPNILPDTNLIYKRRIVKYPKMTKLLDDAVNQHLKSNDYRSIFENLRSLNFFVEGLVIKRYGSILTFFNLYTDIARHHLGKHSYFTAIYCDLVDFSDFNYTLRTNDTIGDIYKGEYDKALYSFSNYYKQTEYDRGSYHTRLKPYKYRSITWFEASRRIPYSDPITTPKCLQVHLHKRCKHPDTMFPKWYHKDILQFYVDHVDYKNPSDLKIQNLSGKNFYLLREDSPVHEWFKEFINTGGVDVESYE